MRPDWEDDLFAPDEVYSMIASSGVRRGRDGSPFVNASDVQEWRPASFAETTEALTILCVFGLALFAIVILLVGAH